MNTDLLFFVIIIGVIAWVIVWILAMTGVINFHKSAGSSSLTPLQTEVQNLMIDLSTCPLKKTDNIGMGGKYQMELPDTGNCDFGWIIPKYSNETHLAYNDALGKVKTIERNNSSRNKDMSWDKVQQSMLQQLA